MTPSLPEQPDLHHLKNQAKAIVKSHKAGDTSVCGMLRGVPRLADMSDPDILAADVSLQEAQHALAKDYGFATWKELKVHMGAAVPGETEEHQDPFDPTTPNDPMVVGGRRMMESTFQDNVTAGTKFLRSNMGGSFFHETNLDGSTFDDVGIRDSTFHNISLANSTFTDASFENVEIEGDVDGMVIEGVPVKDLFDAYEKAMDRKQGNRRRGNRTMTNPVDCFAGNLGKDGCYAWGNLFNASWQDMAEGMSAKAKELGLVQDEDEPYLVWKKKGKENCRWVFVNDPSDIQSVREIYNNEANAKSPACYVVVRQVQMSPDGKRYDRRGDVVFDIFRLAPESYLWHHHRVYTPLKKP